MKEGNVLMKRTNIISLTLLLFCLSGIVTAQDNRENLRRWVGKYPTLKHVKVTTSFFKLPDIQQPLLKLLSRRDYNLLTHEYAVETPIKQIGDYLAVKVCRAHNCDEEQAAFAIDLRTGFIFVRMKSGQEVRWFGSNGTDTDLPSSVRDYLSDFAAT
jgi:hypothetical protein